MNERQVIYDELCRVLTDYEGNGSEEGTTADDLYSMLVKIQNRWEDTITTQDDEALTPEARFDRDMADALAGNGEIEIITTRRDEIAQLQEELMKIERAAS